MTHTVLETRDLTVHFGGLVALKRIRFRLRKGELRCLIGPNGAGKSTFFKCLTGVVNPDYGEVLLLGEECTTLNSNQIARKGVGIKTQTPSVMNGISVHENIWLSARRKYPVKKANRVTDDMLSRFEISDIAGKLVSDLAHGKRQLVEFAMVLAQQPWLVLLDEPAAGMSSEEVSMIANIIHEINKTATIIVVEHDMHFVRMIADRVTVLHQGKILIDDHADAVLSDQVVRDIYLRQNA